MTTNVHDSEDGPTREFRFNVRVPMTDGEEAAFRAGRRLGEGETTRAALAGVVHEQLLGLGVADGWWSRVQVR